MKSRSREVNIFNMSLLDILCGALGAFCFLMLSLFPDHAKVKTLQEQLASATQGGGADAAGRAQEAERRAEEAEKAEQQARAEQSLVFFQVAWTGPPDVDLVLQTPNGKYLASKPDGLPPGQIVGKISDVTKGPGKEITWLSDVAYPKMRYRLFARVHAANGASAPFVVNGYITARVPRGKTSAMGLYDLGFARVPREGELLELGSITFEAEDFTVTNGPLDQTRSSSDAFRPQSERLQLFAPPAAASARP
jgi:hypothetical protein